MIKKNHPKNTENSVYCLVCEKVVNIDHQGRGDLMRHMDGVVHKKSLDSKRNQPRLSDVFMKKNDPIEKQVQYAEVKVSGFLAEHNLPLATADHLTHLFKDIFPDSKIAKSYSCGKTKATCILNRAIKPSLQSELIQQMRENIFSICTDGSNDQNLSKMNPVTVRLFDINQRKVVTKFLDMCLTQSSTAVAIFSSINDAFIRNGVSWEHCVSLGVDNTSVNVGKHNSLIVEARKMNSNIILMGCPCHMAHNTARKAEREFEKYVDFNVEQLLIDIYFHFDYSSKRKNMLVEFCEFCSQEYHKILKFLSVRWLGLSTCLERTLKMYPSLQSYFLSQEPEKKNGKRAMPEKSRLNRLIDAFTNPMTEACCLFLDAALPVLTSLNLMLQRADPVIHLMFEALFACATTLLSRFALPTIVQEFRNGKLLQMPKKDLTTFLDDPANYLPTDKLYVGYLARSKVNKLLDDGDIDKNEYSQFFNGCLCFHKRAFIYAIENFPLNNDLLKQAQFLNFFDQKCSFEDVCALTNKLSSYVSFSKNQMNEMEQEFLLLQTISLDDFEDYVKEEAAIRADQSGEAIRYRIDVLWYYLNELKVHGTQKSKFEQLFKLAKVVLTIVHSNAEEESLFSRVRKNMTPQRASLSLDGTLSSIIAFQLNRAQGEPCYKYKPSDQVLKRSKEVTWEYNKEHLKKH